MLYYGRCDISEGIDVNKTSESKECNICHYRYFLDKEFKFKPDVCKGCKGCYILLMMSINLSNIAYLNLKDANYCCVISGIGKSEAIKML